MNGFLIISLGSSYYANMAYNLAVSIRYHDKDANISVIKAGGSLDVLHKWQRDVFSNEIELDLSKIQYNGRAEFLKTKTLLYELSPYDKTIFLDADTICSPLKNINELFALTGLQIANRGEITEGGGKSEWVNVDEVFETYNINHWYDLSSEFIFFDKSELNKQFFKDAQAFYDDDKIKVVPFKEKRETGKGITMFNGGKPDEVPLGLAVEKNNIRFTTPFKPSYWQPEFFTKIFSDLHIKENYYIISAGGHALQQNIKRIFHDTTKYYYYKMGIKLPPLQLVAKSTIIQERKLI